jgi:isocitrate/isopropylmalate dehydrogenase
VRKASELARTGRRTVTPVDEANALAVCRSWRKVVEEVHQGSPEIALARQ